MNVSKKIFVIIYIIFALLTSVVIFASQNILDSSFSSLEEKEAIENVESVQNVIHFQIIQLEETNSALASREDIRAFIVSENPEDLGGTLLSDLFILNGCDFVFFVNSSGTMIYSQVSDSKNSSNVSSDLIIHEFYRKINEGDLLFRERLSPLSGLLLLENGPVIVSCCPVSAAPDNSETIGTIVLGKKLDSGFVESIQKITGNPVLFYGPDNAPPEFHQAFLENGNENLTHLVDVEGDRLAGYFIHRDINGNPAIMVRTTADRNIYEEGRKSLKYIVFFLLFSGLMVGAGCKFLLDREVVSRLVAIDTFVDKVGKDEDFSAHCIMEGDDELSRLTEGINRMLDRLKLNSDKVKAQEHEKKVILNSLSELVIFMDLELKIVWANRASLDYAGLKLENIIGHSYEELSPMSDAVSGRALAQKALESGKENTGEVATPDGKVWMIRMNLIKDEEGKVTGFLQTGLDITAHRRSEEKLLQAKLEAEAASCTKSEFLANMSHELRTPLNSIIGFSDILIERVFGGLNGKQLKYVNNISVSGKHLLGLINDILDLSKVEAGKMELHYSEFTVDSVFEEVKATLSPLFQAKSLEINFVVGPDFGDIQADRSRIIQILYNLVSNAIKFTPEGGRVSVYCKKSGRRAIFSVMDTGIGISSEDQKKLFQPFTQIDSSSAKQYCGTGLGLALVKKIVNLHQGDIWVESELEKGSTFMFTIPLTKPLESKKTDTGGIEDVMLEFDMSKVAAFSVKGCEEALKEEIELPEIFLPENGEAQNLVLVVDDDINSNELTSVVLREAGYSTASLYNGKDVLEVAKKLKPDVITLDVLLPDISGWNVLKQLKSDLDTTSIPVLIISVTDNNELGVALGATYSFTKPVRRVELLDSLREITGKFSFDEPKVLIIDDDENAVELLSSMIESEGFEIVKAYSGQEGLDKLFSGQQPDILILDLLMPEISGFEVISYLRAGEQTKDIPLILCTAGESTEKNIEELNGELKGHLISIMKKGTFGRKELINRIKQLAMLKRREDERNSYCRR
ncbi:Sensory transduction histidine kinase [Methanosarcina siciliae T4/M]|uniref:histidine kinase n=2 Tax=Methanosarcina siciliae TaxID=38027 RepID=A0A0E3PIA6_9EURY|nr:response regulator [Methanosarcina siciliae]AKB30370.1 Sensory transduction histidine kinase [Methanosarcina siciliae T4/M]AKB34288.1 Sensory transduction histidine kinase [Methanosarcina siciliae HI350]